MRATLICLVAVIFFPACRTVEQDVNVAEEFTYMVNDGQVTITGYDGRNKDLVIPPIIEGYPVTAIAPGAFKGKGNGFGSYHPVDSIILPEGLLSIGAEAFSSNLIKELKLPDSLTYIGDLAFSHNFIQELILPDSLTYIGNEAFGHTPISALAIPDSVTHIGDKAFSKAPLLELELSAGIMFIGKGAFSGSIARIVVNGDGLRLDEQHGFAKYFIRCYEEENLRGGEYRLVKKTWGNRIWARL
jgi:hypothetical protein